jgi:L-iditol 2-dehydrogenase
MKAFVKTERKYGAVEFMDIPRPEPKGDQVLIKICASAICGSDLHAYEYPPGYEFMNIPVALGHEYGGVVEAVGNEATLYKPGERVMGESNQYCSKCQNCHEGRTNICTSSKMTGLHTNGAMAEYIVVSEKIVHRIPETVSFAEAALAQPCAVSFHAVFDRSGIRPGDVVIVFGPGIVGLMAAKGAQIVGASKVFVVGTDVDEAVRLPIAREMGFVTINSQKQDIAAEIEKATGKKQVDIAVECSGAAPAAQAAFPLVRKGGSITLLGIYSKPNEIFFTECVRNEIQINTSYTCLWENYEQALHLVASGQVDLKPLMTSYPFEQGFQAIADALAKKVIKPVLLLD